MAHHAMPDTAPLTLHIPADIGWNNEAFFTFCRANRGLRIERTAEGDITIMTPAGGGTGRRNASLIIALGIWAEQDGTGVVFDSSAGFLLPNNAVRSPDVAWVRRERLVSLAPEQKEKFLPVCPDFVIALRSASDRLADLQSKLAEYLANGTTLGWLIDPAARQVHVYAVGQPTIRLDNPSTLAGDPTLPGFVLALPPLWDPGF